MRKIYPLFAFAVIMIFMVSCKTARKTYEKGDYDQAVELAVKKLQKKPGDGELRSILLNAYNYAVYDRESRVRQHSNSNSDLKWEWMYNEYQSLQNLHDAIRRSPEALVILKPVDYSSYLDTYSEKAAEVRYERGMRWLDRNDRTAYRNAYSEFQAALRFKPHDIDIKQRMEEAYENAVVNVVLLPLDDYRYRYSSYNQAESRNLESELLRNLQYHTGNQFTKFYSEWEARNRNIRVDQLIDLRFTTFNIGRVHDQRSTREVSKDIVIKEIVYKPDSIVKVYGKVYAKITTTRRTMRSDGNLAVNIREADGRWLWSDNFHGDHNWVTEFATYTGDERALSESDKQLISRSHQSQPYEGEIMRHIMNEITNNLQSRIRQYYSY